MRLNKGNKGLRTGILIATLLAMCMVVSANGFAQGKIVQKSRILDRIQTNGVSRVIVTFQVDNLDSLKNASVLAGKAHGQKKEQGKKARALADKQLSDAIDAASRRIRQEMLQKNVVHKRTFKVIPAMVLTVDQAALEALEKHPKVVSVVEDRLDVLPPEPVKPSLDRSQSLDQPNLIETTDVVNVLAAHDRGWNGKGSYVAVLDIGVRTSHEMFSGKTIIEACFSTTDASEDATSICPNGSETQYGTGAAAPPASDRGHGTHVAGIAVGNNKNRQTGEPEKGVAPRANLIAIQVFSRINSGGYGSFPSDQVRALEYIYTNLRGSYSIAAVNLSLGGGLYENPCNADSRSAIINLLHNARIATVAATGNGDEDGNGYCGYTNAPACIAKAIAVGASDDYDTEADFSNWDPDINDLFAPGIDVESAWSDGNSSYEGKNGTSMAAPHVAGAFAILKQAKPTGTVNEFEAALKATGTMVDSLCATGAKPRININAALNQFVTGPAPNEFVLPPIYLLLLGDD